MKTILIIFCLACFVILSVVEGSSAQTTVCSGDSVVLVLTTRTGGSTHWQQSLDKTTWDSAQGTWYNDSLVFAAAKSFYYRAFVIDGTCSPFYSDTTLVIVNPIPPVANPATSITKNSFTANWSPVAGTIVYYYIDVATDAAFTSYVPGKKNIEVHADTTYSIAGLVCNSTYYYRVRAFDLNCGDTGITSANSNTITVTTDTCSPVNCGIITDSRDGKTYKTIIIGTQCWMAQNLNVGTRIDGIRPQTPGPFNQTTSIEKYCYLNLETNCTTYGGLYMWNEMMAYGTSVTDPNHQGICPAGWHLPTDSEWSDLVETLGGSTSAGGKLKDTTLWTPHANGGATNQSGFSALPGGSRNYTGTFGSVGSLASFWTATENDARDARYWVLFYLNVQVVQSASPKADDGFSVRCLKD